MDELISSLQAAAESNRISPATLANCRHWLDNQDLADFHSEIKALIDLGDWKGLNDAFYTQIEFGTAGIRGKTGLGSARINSWTVGTAVQGLANYLLTQGEEAKKRGVVIGSDTRTTSPEFVALVTDILTSNGITIYRFNRPPQVGMFSYAVRLKQAQAGVYISASHNPPTDNGIKIYWEDGCQVLPPHDTAITEAVKQVASITKGKVNKELIHDIGDDFDSAYRARVLAESVSQSRSARIVYSPFHGTGQYGVLPILREAGFEVVTVEEQMEPDGQFPNIPGGIPNPQNRESNQLTAEKVLATGADLGISTDPDADRLALVVPKDGATVILDGNETASLLAYYINQRLKKDEKLPANGFMVRTVPTSPLIDAIAADFGLKCYGDVPVGFKYIGDAIKQHEDFGDELFIFGGEESFGCLKGSYVRDKDASVASLISAEMISDLKDEGRTVWDLFDEVYQRYGYYLNDLTDLKFEGAEGFDKMAKIMNSLRTQPPKQFGSWPIQKVIDRKTNQIKSVDGQVTGKVEGHATNMLVFQLTEDAKNVVIIRPSGTEPKIKVYIQLCDERPKQGTDITQVSEELKTKAEKLKEALKTLADELTK